MVKRIGDPTPAPKPPMKESAAHATEDHNATVDIPTSVYAEWLRATPKEQKCSTD